MTGLGSRRRLPAGGVLAGRLLAAVVVALTGRAGGPNAPVGPESTPPPRTEPATAVDVCDLLPPERVNQLLGASLHVVGRTVASARLPTAGCELGERVDAVVVSVTLEPEAIAAQVFDDAYGDAIGGDPAPVKDIGDRAYLRTENAGMSLHVYVHGGVVSVRVSLEPFDSRAPIRRSELLELTRLAVAEVPASPRLRVLDTSRRCGRVPEAVVEAAVGRAPTLASGADSPTGTVCSWGAQPGSVTARISGGAEAVTRYRDLVVAGRYVHLGDLPGGAAGSGNGIGVVDAWSAAGRPGDLIVLHRRGVVVVTVVPAAGFAESDLPTTPGERELAAALVRLVA